MGNAFILEGKKENVPVKVLMAKLGLDSHWRGAIMVSRYLRDQGMEVIYIGNQTPASIAETALQEDVDVVGLSSSSGNHLILVPRVMEELRLRGLQEVPVILGGTIPSEDYRILQDAGVRGIFGPGRPLTEISECIWSLTKK